MKALVQRLFFAKSAKIDENVRRTYESSSTVLSFLVEVRFFNCDGELDSFGMEKI